MNDRRDTGFVEGVSNMLYGLLVLLALLFVLAAFLLPEAGAAEQRGSSGWRKWHATYNADLDGVSDAAVPSKWLKPGKKARVCYPKTGNCITIKAHAGGCSCFDLSDEAFRKLGGSAAIRDGVITVKAKRL